jgi:DNA-binding protein YbaB
MARFSRRAEAVEVDLLAQARDANPEGALRRVRESVLALRDQLERVRTEEFSGTDPSGAVTAVVTGDGTLRRVDISARALRDLPGAALGAACAAAIRAARLRLAGALQERLGSAAGSLPAAPDPLPPAGEEIRRGMSDGPQRWS